MAKATPKRRTFTDEFKRQVVARILSGEPVRPLAAELGLHNSVIYGWKRDYLASTERPPEAPQSASNKLPVVVVPRNGTDAHSASNGCAECVRKDALILAQIQHINDLVRRATTYRETLRYEMETEQN